MSKLLYPPVYAHVVALRDQEASPHTPAEPAAWKPTADYRYACRRREAALGPWLRALAACTPDTHPAGRQTARRESGRCETGDHVPDLTRHGAFGRVVRAVKAVVRPAVDLGPVTMPEAAHRYFLVFEWYRLDRPRPRAVFYRHGLPPARQPPHEYRCRVRAVSEEVLNRPEPPSGLVARAVGVHRVAATALVLKAGSPAAEAAKAVLDGGVYPCLVSDYPTAEALAAGDPVVWQGLADSGLLSAERRAAALGVVEALAHGALREVRALY